MFGPTKMREPLRAVHNDPTAEMNSGAKTFGRYRRLPPVAAAGERRHSLG